MKKIIVDIFQQIWDGQGLNPIKDNYLCTVCYESCKEIKELSLELRKEILKYKGDGLCVQINEMGEVVFIRIELISDGRHDYIIEYFNRIGKQIEYPIIENYKFEENLLIIENFDEELVDDLIEELGEQKKTGDTIHSIKMYEKGAGDWRSELIFSLLTGVPASIIASWIMDWLSRKKSEYSRTTIVRGLDMEVILEQAAELSGINKNDLLIINIEYSDYDELKYVFITNRYADINIQVNESNEIVQYKLDQKTKTRV